MSCGPATCGTRTRWWPDHWPGRGWTPRRCLRRPGDARRVGGLGWRRPARTWLSPPYQERAWRAGSAGLTMASDARRRAVGRRSDVALMLAGALAEIGEPVGSRSRNGDLELETIGYQSIAGTNGPGCASRSRKALHPAEEWWARLGQLEDEDFVPCSRTTSAAYRESRLASLVSRRSCHGRRSVVGRWARW
jgi:hypothetical protein